jgi:hypothetical protein
MKINTIVLDLDDTLNAFTMFVLGNLGCGVGPYDYEEFPDVGFDLRKAWWHLQGRCKPYPKLGEFWEWVTEDMWATCPISPQFWLLGWSAAVVGRENVIIATCPTKSRECVAGKYTWIERYLPEWAQRQYAITPRKHFFAQPGALLIDDHDKNIKEFRAAGGEAIVVPRPWNSMWGAEPDTYLMDRLLDFNYENVIT